MAKPASRPRNPSAAGSARKARRWPWVLLVLALILGGVFIAFRTPITGYASAGTAYSARVACSCRFVAGRDLADCEKDLLTGMELVMLSEDEEARSVTATFPLITSDTARLRDGYGCVLDRWEG
ncbi:hypothetical protein ACFCW2_05270 [Qipengyuania sp. DSG2-2]|uniref:hypothetical protein n=1 Tax=Qipengyuania sp. DGS2-2 TaxID=3349631 RepID=UPI0036D28FE7